MTITSIPAPTSDRLIVKRDETPKTSVHGIILPGSESPPSRGTVLAAGPGRTTPSGTLIPTSVKAGDRVLFNAYAATNPFDLVDEQGKKQTLMILSEGDVLALIED